MIKSKLLLITACVTSFVFICGMGSKESETYTFDKDYKTMYEDAIKEGRLDNKETAFISAWCKNYFDGSVTWACMDDDYETYQINFITEYGPSDFKEIINDLAEKEYSLNQSPFKDLTSVNTICLKYMDNDGIPLAEFIIAKENGKFSTSSYLMNAEYVEIFDKALAGN